MSWQCTSWALREAPAPTATARLVLIALAVCFSKLASAL